MRTIYLFGNQLNGLEFVTYVLIPSSIVLVILVYIFFNIRLLKLSFDFDINIIKNLDKEYNEKLEKLKKELSKDEIVNDSTKEKI